MARPIQYDRNAVLEKAMRAFWDKGYHATSMADLIQVTNLRPGSLYAAFHSKEALFMETLDHYGSMGAAALAKMLGEAESPLQGVKSLFIYLADEAADRDALNSCFLVNTVLELARHNDTAHDRARHHLGIIEGILKDALEAAKSRGELRPESDPAELAAFLICNIWGLRVLGGTSPSKERARSVAKRIVSCLE